MKTKSEEIAVLDEAIKSLGPDSYLGPWLAQIRGGIVDLVKCDIFPDITLAEAAKTSEGIKLAAQTEAADLIDAARIKAEQIRKNASDLQDKIAGNMRDALRALERW